MILTCSISWSSSYNSLIDIFIEISSRTNTPEWFRYNSVNILALQTPIPLICCNTSIISFDSLPFNSCRKFSSTKNKSARFKIYLVLEFDNPHFRICWNIHSFINCGIISFLPRKSFRRLKIVDVAALDSCWPDIILTNTSKFESLFSGSSGLIYFITFTRNLSFLLRYTNPSKKLSSFDIIKYCHLSYCSTRLNHLYKII